MWYCILSSFLRLLGRKAYLNAFDSFVQRSTRIKRSPFLLSLNLVVLSYLCIFLCRVLNCQGFVYSLAQICDRKLSGDLYRSSSATNTPAFMELFTSLLRNLAINQKSRKCEHNLALTRSGRHKQREVKLTSKIWGAICVKISVARDKPQSLLLKYQSLLINLNHQC